MLVSETGELTEQGRAYTPPRALLEALHVICSGVGQWGDQGEAEKIAMEIIEVAHHPSIGRASHPGETTRQTHTGTREYMLWLFGFFL